MKITDEQVRAAWDALGPKNTVHMDYEDFRTALEAALAVEDTEYEYGTPYAHMWKVGVRFADAWKDESQARAMVAESNGERILVRRAKRGDWEEVEED